MPDSLDSRGGNRPDVELVVRLPDWQATEKLGEIVGAQVKERAIVALVGTLGAGKTTFVKGLARALGVTEVVNSPTFTMLNEYHSGRLPLYHLDLYRLKEDQAAVLNMLEIELDELLEENMVAVMEWAELLDISGGKNYLEQLDHLVVSIQYGGTEVKASEANNKKVYPVSHGEGRTAFFSSLGGESSALIRSITDQLGDMFIYS